MPTQTARSRRVQLHRVGKSFKGIESRQHAGKLRLHLVVDCVRHQDLARFSDGLCAGRSVDDRAGGGHGSRAARPAHQTETQPNSAGSDQSDVTRAGLKQFNAAPADLLEMKAGAASRRQTERLKGASTSAPRLERGGSDEGQLLRLGTKKCTFCEGRPLLRVEAVIPAIAGIHPSGRAPLDPRFRGGDKARPRAPGDFKNASNVRPGRIRELEKRRKTAPNSLHFLPFLAANRDLSKGWRRLSGKNSFWATSPGRPPRAPLRWIANGRRGRQSGFDGTGQTALSFRTGHRNKYGT